MWLSVQYKYLERNFVYQEQSLKEAPLYSCANIEMLASFKYYKPSKLDYIGRDWGRIYLGVMTTYDHFRLGSCLVTPGYTTRIYLKLLVSMYVSTGWSLFSFLFVFAFMELLYIFLEAKQLSFGFIKVHPGYCGIFYCRPGVNVYMCVFAFAC